MNALIAIVTRVTLVVVSVAMVEATAQEPVWKPGQSRPPALDYDFIDSYLDYRIYDLPPEVVFVQRFGRWSEGGQTGLLRLIIAEPASAGRRRHLIYVQWVCDCAAGVVAMTPVSAINRRSPMIFTVPSFDRTGSQNYVDVLGQEVVSRRTLAFRLMMPERGSVEVEER